jgi:hypothetical protein
MFGPLAIAFKAAVVACVLGGCDAKIPEQLHTTAADPNAIAAEAAKGCKDDPSEKAAQLAREKYPDSLTWPDPPNWTFPDLWAARATFLREDRWKLFDFNHDGRMDFDGYHAWLWANDLAGATAGRCIVTKEDYIVRVLGKRGAPSNGWSTSSTKVNIDSILSTFSMMDRENKGFIVKKDTFAIDKGTFDRADTRNIGYLTPDQRF